MLDTLKKIAIGILVFLGALGVIGTGIVMIQGTGQKQARPDKDLDQILEARNVSGRFSVMVARNPHRFYGSTLQDEKQNPNQVYERHFPPQEDGRHAVFNIGAGEHFTAMAIMMLADAGSLELDGLARDLDPLLPEPFQKITVRSLLTHTSGLHANQLDVNQIDSLDASPLEVARYAPVNVMVLNRLVKKLSGQETWEYIEAKLIEPLGLEHTTYTPGAEGNPGAWSTCMSDLDRWEMTMNSNRFVKLKTLLASFTAPKLDDGQWGQYGFGWSIESYRNFRIEQTADPAAPCKVIRFSEKGLSIIVMTEDASFDFGKLARQICDIYLGRETRFNAR